MLPLKCTNKLFKRYIQHIKLNIWHLHWCHKIHTVSEALLKLNKKYGICRVLKHFVLCDSTHCIICKNQWFWNEVKKQEISNFDVQIIHESPNKLYIAGAMCKWVAGCLE
jgi:hypothetical protein